MFTIALLLSSFLQLTVRTDEGPSASAGRSFLLICVQFPNPKTIFWSHFFADHKTTSQSCSRCFLEQRERRTVDRDPCQMLTDGSTRDRNGNKDGRRKGNRAGTHAKSDNQFGRVGFTARQLRPVKLRNAHTKDLWFVSETLFHVLCNVWCVLFDSCPGISLAACVM